MIKMGEVSAAVKSRLEGLYRWAKLERMLALVLLAVPFVLVGFDHNHVRGSISEYHDMAAKEVYFYPLTVAAMLFLVNGVVKNRSRYNVMLGVALSLVILFNHEAWPKTHAVAAVVFFGGNVAVMLWFATRINRPMKQALAAGIVIAMLANLYFKWISLFWAETASLLFIVAHFWQESKEESDEIAAT